ncbi:MAG TPA: DUF3307 domain-containing protein [Patescibacteria group bacterium]|jgi:hypothetical protein|nr:DUF3307 domain-containing protein [Patescibacteria group bacterium]
MKFSPFEAALLLHLIGDWLLQNEWMAVNKLRLTHPAAWLHATIHGVLLGLVFGWLGGLVLAVVHALVDTRVPIRWWIKVFKKCEAAVDLPILLIGCDQVIHICCIAGWMLIANRLR